MLLQETRVPPLADGDSVDVWTSTGPLGPGDRVATLVVDALDAVAESNEADNARAMTFATPLRANVSLALLAHTVPPQGSTGQHAVTYRVCNHDTHATPSIRYGGSAVYVPWRVVTPTESAPPPYRYHHGIGKIAAGACVERTLTFTPSLVGRYELELRVGTRFPDVDPADNRAESVGFRLVDAPTGVSYEVRL